MDPFSCEICLDEPRLTMVNWIKSQACVELTRGSAQWPGKLLEFVPAGSSPSRPSALLQNKQERYQSWLNINSDSI